MVVDYPMTKQERRLVRHRCLELAIVSLAAESPVPVIEQQADEFYEWVCQGGDDNA